MPDTAGARGEEEEGHLKHKNRLCTIKIQDTDKPY